MTADFHDNLSSADHPPAMSDLLLPMDDVSEVRVGEGLAPSRSGTAGVLLRGTMRLLAERVREREAARRWLLVRSVHDEPAASSFSLYFPSL
jgi:hypothetical protein